MFCFICIAFGLNTASSNFSSPEGCNNFKHVYSAIERHENSHIHSNAVEHYFRASNEISIEYSINQNLVIARKKDVENNIHILKQVFDIVKFIGRQNLPYRGPTSNEPLANFNDIASNKGNFLEMIKFAAQRDSILNEHLQQSIKKSKLRKVKLEQDNKLNSKGRGSLVTFLSKTTVDKVI